MNTTVGPTLASSQGNGFICPSMGKLVVGSQSQDNSSQLIALSLSKQSASMQMPAFGKLDAGGTPTPSASQAPSALQAPAETASADAAPAEAAPADTAPADATATNIAPTEAASASAAPAETAPASAAPAETAPANALADTAPVIMTPAETTPAAAPATPPDLTPVSINSDNNQSAPAATTGGDGDNAEMLKTSVTRNELAPKGPVEDDPALSSQSVISSKKSAGDKLKKGKEDVTEQARKVNVMPMALQTTDDEQKDTDKRKYSAEQQEMSDLWDATLGRNQDIQFVIQKLMPSNNNGQTGFILSKLISTAMMGGASAAMMMAPNMGSQMGMSAGSNLMFQALNGVQSKQAKKARLAESEQIKLYNMVRNTADRMVENFRSYKKNVSQLKTASNDLEDLRNMVKDASTGAGPAVEMEYTLRKQQRDIDALTDDAKKYRQALVDTAGPDAVSKLDNQLANEGIGPDSATSAPSPSVPEARPAQPTAAAQPQTTPTAPAPQAAQAPTPAPSAGAAQTKKKATKATTKTASKPATPGSKKAQKIPANPQIGSAPNGATQ